VDIAETINGPNFTLYSIVVENRCYVEEFVANLEEKDLKQVLTLFELIATTGPPHNEEKFRDIGEKIFELKTRRGVRILGFFAGPTLPKSLILTHGFYKPHNKILVRERDKAVKWRKEYFDSSEINIVETNGGD